MILIPSRYLCTQARDKQQVPVSGLLPRWYHGRHQHHILARVLGLAIGASLSTTLIRNMDEDRIFQELKDQNVAGGQLSSVQPGKWDDSFAKARFQDPTTCVLDAYPLTDPDQRLYSIGYGMIFRWVPFEIDSSHTTIGFPIPLVMVTINRDWIPYWMICKAIKVGRIPLEAFTVYVQEGMGESDKTLVGKFLPFVGLIKQEVKKLNISEFFSIEKVEMSLNGAQFKSIVIDKWKEEQGSGTQVGEEGSLTTENSSEVDELGDIPF